ncbi:calcium-independent phospholipase A2-gamma-like [Cimex lectularius]|uniref:PNPLA domain-containing protein n=1 Tax=Cimex lectularius TaxID=79782 RepID=A0A8I6S6D8_CIMLE|nr:calcium-independent phospholipase A2-gamma-like [Cimex lectularius]
MAPIMSVIKNIINHPGESLKKVKMIIMTTNLKIGNQKGALFYITKNPESPAKEFKTTTQKESSQKTTDNNQMNISEEPKFAKENERWLSHLYYNLDIPQLFEDIKQKMSYNKSTPEVKVPAWKTTRRQITQEKINSETSYLLSLLIKSESAGSRLKRLENFLSHLITYPEAKEYAVEEGVIPSLLEFQKLSRDASTTHIVRQILVTLGYVEPPKSYGVRLLSIDGGGMRGIAVINMLEKLEELSGRKILELFDFVCGVSTGAIIICCLLPPHEMSLSEIKDLYRNLSAQVFTQSTLRGTSNLVWSHGYYDTAAWEKLLKCYVGETKLLDSAKHEICPKAATISTIINKSKVAPYIFRNYDYPYNRKSEYAGSINHTMFQAVRASAAAPTIFEEFRIGDILHQDGGMIVNNPAAVAVHEVRTLWPDESLSCVVSCGTGKLLPTMFQDEISADAKQTSSSWKTIFNKILESATDTEAVHNMLNDLLPEDVYYRINPHLSRKVTMDDVHETTISLLEADTEMYYRRNKEKFQEIVKKLLLPRSKVQLCQDYVMTKLREIKH